MAHGTQVRVHGFSDTNIHTNSRIQLVCFVCKIISKAMAMRRMKQKQKIRTLRIIFLCLKRLLFLCCVSLPAATTNFWNDQTAATLMPIDGNYLSKYYLIYFGIRPNIVCRRKFRRCLCLFFGAVVASQLQPQPQSQYQP